MNGEQQLDADAGSGVEEVELSWEDYLEETGSTAVPYGSFKHVSSNCIALLFVSVSFDLLCHH
ncbi:Scm like with four mbt domains 1 [Phyllostomus discolor]|uniref:Scm like with four mbt domains 1 n=1 Tax=Phyllostomus discolor TaxID=89673 RepID=A0A833ZYF6_9CHIR|nr:Scm like with four mbt domains 1 [Phyllostomus discolor]